MEKHITTDTFRNGSIKEVRLALRINQQEFWSRIGITQSGGSRYESGRRVPLPVKKLLVIAYGPDELFQKTVDELRYRK